MNSELLYNSQCIEKDQKGEECIIALKVYDQCRIQECLTSSILGPARYAGTAGCALEGQIQITGEPIIPPPNASGVTIVPGSLTTPNIIIVGKTVNPFKPGYYDIDLKIVFSYRIKIFRADGSIINLICSSGLVTDEIPAESIINKKVTLFGSIASNISITSDFIPGTGVISGDPNIFVESKAIELRSQLSFTTPCISIGTGDFPPIPNGVDVTIGLFLIVKTVRLVQLTVESLGFCKPEPCPGENLTPCELFSTMEFPFDAFYPPQK